MLIMGTSPQIGHNLTTNTDLFLFSLMIVIELYISRIN